MLSLLSKYSYGHTPNIPSSVSAKVTASDPKAYAGKVLCESIELTVKTERGEISYPFELYIPHKEKNPPLFFHIAFGKAPHKYIPVEEITDAGYALLVLVYTDMVNDKHFGDFSDGIAAYFGTTNDRAAEEWGKIGMWAWGASRVLDYLICERRDVDTKKIAVIGHSRLGKTALWCAAQDERFACAISNNSGYGGAASSKHGTGERVTDFIEVGSDDWYCENFKLFAGEMEDNKPYDQSFLLAAIAPRLLCVGSAIEDKGADPENEFLTTLHASQAWELLGKKGLACENRLAKPGDLYIDGCVGYHLRAGTHFLSREDWGAYIKFLDKHFKNK